MAGDRGGHGRKSIVFKLTHYRLVTELAVHRDGC
jgi:hypothetical protein